MHPRVLVSMVLAASTTGVGCQPVTGDVPLSGTEIPVASGYTIERVLTGLERPWAFTWFPNRPYDGLITERAGRLRVVRNGQLLPDPAYAFGEEIFARGQGGLMDVALHPDFTENQLVYLTYSEGTGDKNRTVLARSVLNGDQLEKPEVIFAVNRWKRGGQHFGSRILWLPDGTLLLAIGDGGNPPVRYDGDWIRKQARDPAAHLGKVLHLNDDGSPAGGADLGEDAAPEVYSYGHRNIQGLARDPATGAIWANEHGARGGDELNLIEPGKDYGWPDATYSREYSGPRITRDTDLPGVTDPKIVWTPSKAPSGLAFYTGDAFPQWQGDLFSGALVHRHIRRIDLEGTRVVGEQKIPTDGRVRDVRQGPDGLIYFVTDERDGELLRLVPADL